MKYTPLSKELYIQNRERYTKQLKPNSIAVFHSNDIMPTNADGTMNFIQNSDLLYLSGIDQEESILVLYPDFHDEKLREVLFLKPTSKEIAIWEGEKYTKEAARAASGVDSVYWLSDFKRLFNTLMAEAEHVYLNTNEHIRAVVEVETRDARFVKWCKEHYPLHTYHRSAPVLNKLRAVKSQFEIDALQTACDISEKGFRRILGFVKPGVMEYEIEAEYIHEFVRNRSRGFAYTPIVASGPNACVLHYITNNQQCQEGHVLLMDVGAEYANYAADMTRSIPVGGRFSPWQRRVYDAVLRVKRAAMDMLRPGNTITEYHKEVGKVMEGELLDLGLLTKKDIADQKEDSPAYKKYFMHGTSHHLGLDVHDVGNIYMKMEPGMVFTVEPGIYVRDKDNPSNTIGIRLENDVVITEDGLIDLMRNIPIEAEEIEDLMNQ